MSRFIVKKSSSCTGRRKWPLINAVIIAVETGASSWSTICVHFPVNRGALPHSVVWQRAPEELRRLYDIHFKEDNRTFVLLLDYARKNGFSGTDIVTACKELTGRGVRKISPDQVKAMLHGSVQGETEETMEPPVLPAQQENIEREAVDMLEGITALMTGYNEVHDIIPTI